MDQKMNVQVSFSANTSQAKKEIQSLIQDINSLSTKTLKSSLVRDIGEDTKQAAHEVTKFSALLERAVNVDTGKLDLTKLNKSLKESNTSLPKMANNFKALGNDGVRAFANIVNQINAAEAPMRKMNATVDKLWTSLKNTANWTISSSAINALVGGIQSAYRYAQDLDKSLNNIRIVTGYNADKMSKFAIEANKAAKALNTTTQNYTDASLIFYQQGLSDAEVAKRTDVVIKMANVTGEAAEKISDQMTAVWNNFNDGSKSLEYYADVLTKLGATTASSTDEIVGGLEKFAAVADTIGLSYEYAASALATITSNTRQSEEVVGTALKTIFARIQGLNLGETLDDGTTLNKYSEALQKVGISIFDQAGNLKKMDTILEEMGAKWGTLSDSQQVALAQTVAGVRQYNQLVALMDSWNKSTTQGGVSMAENLRTTQNATGELSKQASIYADGWKAAQDRVQASAEKLYDTLIDEDFFKDILDATSGILDFITDLTKGLGGVEGLLSTIAAYVMTVARTKISEELIRLTQPSFKKQQETAIKTKEEANAELSRIAQSSTASKVEQVTANTYKNISDVQIKMIRNSQRLTEEQKAQIQAEIEQYKVVSSVLEKKAEEVKLAEDEMKYAERTVEIMNRQAANKAAKDINNMTGAGGLLNRRGRSFSEAEIAEVDTLRSSLGLNSLTEEQRNVLAINTGAAESSHLQKYAEVIRQIKQELQGASEKLNDFSEKLKSYKSLSQEVANIEEDLFNIDEGDNAKQQISDIINKLKELDKAQEGGLQNFEFAGRASFESLIQQLQEAEVGSLESEEAINQLAEALEHLRNEAAIDLGTNYGADPEYVDNYTRAVDKAANSTASFTRQQKRNEEQGKKLGENFDNLNAKLPTWQEAVVAAAGAITSFVAAGRALAGMWDVINDPDMSPWEKIGTIFSTLATVIPSLVMAFKSLQDVMGVDVLIKAMDTAVTKANTEATKENSDAQRENKEVRNNVNNEINEGLVSKGADAVMDTVDGAGDTAKNMGKNTGDGFKQAGSKFAELKTSAGKFFTTFKGVMGGLGLIAAGVTVAVAAISWGVQQWNKHVEAAKEAAEAAALASQAYDEAASSYNDLLSTISTYEDARDGIDELTYGTAEFREAILKANESAMELINTYEGLEYSIDKDGLIIIDEKSLERAKQAQLDILENAQRTKQLAVQNANEKQLQSDMVDFQRKHLRSAGDAGWAAGNTAATTGSGVIAGALTGAGIGLVAGHGVFSLPAAIAGLVIGGVAGLITGLVGTTGGSSTDTESKVLQQLADIYKTEGSAAFASKEALEELLREELGIKDEALISSLINNKDATLDLVKEIAANTAAIQAYNASVIQQEFGKDLDATGLSEEVQAAVSMAMGVDLEAEKQKLYEDKYKDQMGGLTDAEIQKQYAEAMGYTVLKNESGNKAIYYDNKTGKEIHLDDATARMYLAEQEALKGMNVASHEATKMLQKLSKSSDAAGKGLMQFIEDANFAGMTKAEFNAFSNQINANGGELETTEVEDYFTKTLGLTEDQLLTLAESKGFASVEAFITSFIGAFEDYSVDYDKVYNNLVPGVKAIVDGLSEAIKNSLTTAELGQIAKIIEDAYLISGQTGAEFMASMIEAAGAEGLELAEVLNTLDWNTMDATSLSKALKDAGIATNFTVDELEDMIDVMTHDGPKAVEALAKEFQILSELEKLKQGDVISQETYNSIDENLRSYFTRMADGTYKLTQDALDFYQAVQGGVLDALKEQFSEESNRIALLDQLMEVAAKVGNVEHQGAFATDRDLFYANYDDYAMAMLDSIPELTVVTQKAQSVNDFWEMMWRGASNKMVNTTQQVRGVTYNPETNEFVPVKSTYQDYTYSAAAVGKYQTDGGPYEVAGATISQGEDIITIKTTGVPELDDGTNRYKTDKNGNLILTGDGEYSFWTEKRFNDERVQFSGAWWDQYARQESATTGTSPEDIARNQLMLLSESAWGQISDNAKQIQFWLEQEQLTAEQIFEIQDAWASQKDQILLETEQELEKLKKSIESTAFQSFSETKSAQEREELYDFYSSLPGEQSEQVKNAYAAASLLKINEEKYEGMDLAAIDDYAAHLKSIAKESELIDDNLSQEAAEDVALYTMKMNQGIEKLKNGFEDWNSVLQESDESSQEYSEALSNMKDAVSDLLGTSEDFISKNFITKHLQDIEKASKGSAEAINSLRIALSQDIIFNIAGVESFDELREKLPNIAQSFEAFYDMLQTESPNIEIGAYLKDDAFTQAANQLVEDAKFTTEQAQAFFNSLGYEPIYATETVDIPSDVPIMATDTAEITGGSYTMDGLELAEGETLGNVTRTVSRTHQIGTTHMDTKMDVVAFSADGKPKIEGYRRSTSGELNNYSTFNPGGGGGGKSKPTKKPKKSGTVKRYKELDDSLNEVSKAYDKANKQADKLFGKKRLDAIDEQNRLLQKQITLLRQKLGLEVGSTPGDIATNLQFDQKALDAAASALGLKFTYDPDTQSITNYTEQMNALYDSQLSSYFNSKGELIESKREAYEAFEEKLNDLKEAMSQYEETLNLRDQVKQMVEDAWDTWRANNYEKLRYELELKIDIDEAELRRVDYYLNKYQDDFYKRAESLSLMMDEQLKAYLSLIETYKEHAEDLDAAYAKQIDDEYIKSLDDSYAKGEISQADYIAGLKEVREGIYSQLEALLELDRTMKNYYGETLVAAREELDKYTSRLDHNISLLEHFNNLMDLMGKTTDYDAMLKLTQNQTAISRNKLDISKQWLSTLLENQKDLEEEMAKAAGDEKATEILQKKWDDLTLQIEQAQSDILENTEAWLENMKTQLDLKMSQLTEDLEKTLTKAWGFVGADGEAMWGFDELTKQFNRLSTVQEEYLTKTNQIYETNKLMNQAQQELDKTDNEVSKQKLQNFIKETKGLQDTTKLSNFQLKIQQAKYDLLLAEMALEEAKDAKSIVRLKRDQAGNYGYVYTADQDKINEAAQKVADAENNIYNISLEAQQRYTQMYMQETQNFFNDLAALNEIRSKDEAEYQRRKEALIEQYFGANGILTNISHLYNLAVQADTDAAADNWMTQHANMIGDTEQWRDEVEDYIEDIDDAWEDWQEAITQAQQDANEALKDTSGGTKDLVSDSQKLADFISGTLIGKLDDEIDKVDAVTDAYAYQRDTIWETIEAMEAYLRTLDDKIRKESGVTTAATQMYDDYSAEIAHRVINNGADILSEEIQDLLNARQIKLDAMDPDEASKYVSNQWLQDVLAKAQTDETVADFVRYVLSDGNAWFNIDSLKKFIEETALTEAQKQALKEATGWTGFKTGGYTGSWGPEGRLAVLHQKELVLNAQDTANLLDTISIVRSTISDLKRFGEWIPRLITPRIPDVELQPVEKIVQIEASFPGVRDRYEIEEAFNNLINTASQFANRKRI